jgi:hypothetical protein
MIGRPSGPAYGPWGLGGGPRLEWPVAAVHHNRENAGNLPEVGIIRARPRIIRHDLAVWRTPEVAMRPSGIRGRR